MSRMFIFYVTEQRPKDYHQWTDDQMVEAVYERLKSVERRCSTKSEYYRALTEEDKKRIIAQGIHSRLGFAWCIANWWPCGDKPCEGNKCLRYWMKDYDPSMEEQVNSAYERRTV